MEPHEPNVARCPHCGDDILNKVLFLATGHIESCKTYFTDLKRYSSGVSPILTLSYFQEDALRAYTTGTKVSNKTIQCNSCKQDVTISINDTTGVMSGFDTELKHSYRFKRREVVPLVTDKKVPVNEERLTIKEPKDLSTKEKDLGYVTKPSGQLAKSAQPLSEIDEEAKLYIQRYPGVATYKN